MLMIFDLIPSIFQHNFVMLVIRLQDRNVPFWLFRSFFSLIHKKVRPYYGVQMLTLIRLPPTKWLTGVTWGPRGCHFYHFLRFLRTLRSREELKVTKRNRETGYKGIEERWRSAWNHNIFTSNKFFNTSSHFHLYAIGFIAEKIRLSLTWYVRITNIFSASYNLEKFNFNVHKCYSLFLPPHHSFFLSFDTRRCWWLPHQLSTGSK